MHVKKKWKRNNNNKSKRRKKNEDEWHEREPPATSVHIWLDGHILLCARLSLLVVCCFHSPRPYWNINLVRYDPNQHGSRFLNAYDEMLVWSMILHPSVLKYSKNNQLKLLLNYIFHIPASIFENSFDAKCCEIRLASVLNNSWKIHFFEMMKKKQSLVL